MTLSARQLHSVGVSLFALFLCACASNPFSSSLSPSSEPQPQAAPPSAPEIPASIRPEEVVGRWGYGSYHNDADRKRTEAAARSQCGQPVVINRGAARRGADVSRRQRAIAGAQSQGQSQRQEFCRPAWPARRSARSRIRHVRRPRYGAALDQSGSAGPLRHGRLCSLRCGRDGASTAAATIAAIGVRRI